MITAIYISQFIWPVFLLAMTTTSFVIFIILINMIRQTLKTIALDVAQVINYFKTDTMERYQKQERFEIACLAARQRIWVNRKLLQTGQSAMMAMAWQAGKFDIEVEDATTKHKPLATEL